MMMPGRSYTPAALVNGVVVICPQFCVGYPVDLTVSRKLMTLEEVTFGVTDVNGNIMFKIRGKVFSIHDRRVLLDAAETPIITFQQKMHRKHSAQSILLGKDTFGVTVYPNVDYAFIVALVVILEEINEDRSGED